MEDRFDKYLKQELDSISDASFPPKLWDKEKTWRIIASGLKPQGKTISIKWLYAAASVVLIVLSGSSIYHIKYSNQISLMKKENNRLLNMIAANNTSLKQDENKPDRIATAFQVKERIKKEIVFDTIFIHDTITIISYIKDTVNEQIALNTRQVVVDSSIASSSDVQVKNNELHFVTANEPNRVKSDNKYTLVSSKSLFHEEQEIVESEGAFKIVLK